MAGADAAPGEPTEGLTAADAGNGGGPGGSYLDSRRMVIPSGRATRVRHYLILKVGHKARNAVMGFARPSCVYLRNRSGAHVRTPTHGRARLLHPITEAEDEP